eukprot:scaffold29905_cov64-Phaeocystis_antarctica.AAC.16
MLPAGVGPLECSPMQMDTCVWRARRRRRGQKSRSLGRHRQLCSVRVAGAGLTCAPGGSTAALRRAGRVDEVKAHAEMAVAAQRSLCGWVRDPIMYCFGSKEQCGSEQRHEVLCRQRWRSDPHLMKHVGDGRPR